MRVNVDSVVFTDPRFEILAQSLGIEFDAVIGKCLRIWMVCNERSKGTLKQKEVDVIARVAGFADAMIEADLARITEEGVVQIAGWEKRSNWLKTRQESGRLGGMKSGEIRRELASDGKPSKEKRRSPKAASKVDASNSEPSFSVSGSGSFSVSGSGSEVTQSAFSEQKSGSGHREAIDFFDKRYSAVYGSRCTWNGRSAKGIGALVKTHGSAEVQRRIAVLFDSPPKWLRPPFDVATLVQHFDKLQSVRPDARVGRVEPLASYGPNGVREL